MQRSQSLESILTKKLTDNFISSTSFFDPCSLKVGVPKRRYKGDYFRKHDCVTFRSGLHKSSSWSEVNSNKSDFTNGYLNQILLKGKYKKILNSCSGDGSVSHWISNLPNTHYIPWTTKGKNSIKTSEMNTDPFISKFAKEYLNCNNESDNNEPSSSCDNKSSSEDQLSMGKGIPGAAFPFESTPSGNLKVQSNQVVFQSSTLGLLLADPTQAKVKVRLEGRAAGEPNDSEPNYDTSDAEPQLQFGNRDTQVMSAQLKGKQFDKVNKTKSHSVREDKGKDLESLGYALPEPVDWLRVQLPKKQDLFQEFYRRVHQFINTDTVVYIDDKEFHCHNLVLQVYSGFFNSNRHREIELPSTSVTTDAFHSIYEWMICNVPESNKLLRRDNVLDLFCAAQFLSIKDLEDQCWAFIINENLFNEDTAFALYKEAKIKRMKPVLELMVPRVMRFFLPLVASRDFLELDPDDVMTFLKSNNICVTSEIEVLMAGVRWLYGDWATRRCLAVEVMRCVRFGLISPWQLVDIKRNPDNGEILDIVNEPQVQQMVDDGLAYVIIKYWYGNNSKNYYHWIDVLGLTEPAERNWIGEEKNHVTYKDFLKYLEQFMVPKDQMYQQMAMLQPARRNEDNVPESMRGGMDNESRRPKFDFPLPATLKGLTGDRDNAFPTMSEFFDTRKKDNVQLPTSSRSSPPPRNMECPQERQQDQELEDNQNHGNVYNKTQKHTEDQKRSQLEAAPHRKKHIEEVRMFNVEQSKNPSNLRHLYETPEKDSAEDITSARSETSSAEMGSIAGREYLADHSERRQSAAANYLATATAALAGSSTSRNHQCSSSPGSKHLAAGGPPRPLTAVMPTNSKFSPQISLFNNSKDSVARANMNKLSASVLGPSNKSYIAVGSLFDWEHETVLVFGGIDPHATTGVGRCTGKDIYRFDPVNNVWEHVGELPEPRHHHSVAFLKGRVYLAGGADPRDDDIRGKSVVVSTVYSFEPVSRSWFSETGLSCPRRDFGLVVHKMALYAIGGQDKKGRILRSVEKFDPKSGVWTEMKPMRVARMAVATTKYREYIWAAGGMTGEKKKPVCKTVECYNSKTNEWTEIHNLRFPRCFASLFAVNDKLYIVGGAGRVSEKDKSPSSVGSLDTWDWEKREWKQQTEMSIPRHGHALTYLGSQLIIIGGVTTIYMRALANVESYCCERGAWIRGVSPLPYPLSGHGAVTLPPASIM